MLPPDVIIPFLLIATKKSLFQKFAETLIRRDYELSNIDKLFFANIFY